MFCKCSELIIDQELYIIYQSTFTPIKCQWQWVQGAIQMQGKKGAVRSSSACGIIFFWHLLFSSIDVHAYVMIVYLCVCFIYSIIAFTSIFQFLFNIFIGLPTTEISVLIHFAIECIVSINTHTPAEHQYTHASIGPTYRYLSLFVQKPIGRPQFTHAL